MPQVEVRAHVEAVCSDRAGGVSVAGALSRLVRGAGRAAALRAGLSGADRTLGDRIPVFGPGSQGVSAAGAAGGVDTGVSARDV